MNFYITTDLKDSRVFIAPTVVSSPAWLIECTALWKAEHLLRKLTAQLWKDPKVDPHSYQQVSTEEIPGMGKVEIWVRIDF